MANKAKDISEAMANPDSGLVDDADDADDVRGYEHPDANEVREGRLSAAQLPTGGEGTEEFPDAQYPPGIVETAASTRGATPVGADDGDEVYE